MRHLIPGQITCWWAVCWPSTEVRVPRQLLACHLQSPRPERHHHFPLLSSVALQVHFGTTYRDTVAFVVDPVLVALLIVQAIAFREMIFWRWLQLAWVRYLGRISY